MSIFGAALPTFPPDHEVEGETFKQWADRLFEFEFCEQCGGDTEDHTPLLVMGHWVAMCKLYTEEET